MPLWIGWLGMSCIVLGTYLPAETSHWLFLAGTVTLGVSAILGKSRFYVALQGPIIIGALTAFLPNSYRIVGLGMMAVGIIIAVLYLARVGEFADRPSKIGAIGLVLLAAGFASGTKLWLLPANAALLFNAVYRFNHKGEKIAIVWLVLEVLAAGGTIFSMVSASH